MATLDYTPPPTVERFIKSEKFYNWIIGPVGSGKTVGALFKILYHAQRQKPSPHDGIRRTRWVVVRNTRPKLKDTTMKSFFSWFIPGVAGRWWSTDDRFVFRFADVHAEVLFRPLDTPDDVGRVLSLEVTGAVIDEFIDIPHEIIEALGPRCGRFPPEKDGGPSWWGMWGASNPGNEDNWWFDWLYEPWPEDDQTRASGKTKNDMLGYFEQPSGFAPEAENIENLPGKRQYYHDQAVGKSKSWVRQFLEVHWGFSVSGTPVYGLFNEEIHVAKKELWFNPALPLVIGMDAGLTPAAILGQQDLNGRIIVLEEVVAHNMGAKRFCREKLLPVLNQRFSEASELMVCLDPAAGNRSEADETTVMQVVKQELKIPVVLAHSNLFEPRRDSVDHYLSTLTPAGPGYIVDPKCKVLIRGFMSGYRFDVNRKGVQDNRPAKNDYSHPHDANQYLCMAFLKYAAVQAKRRMAETHVMRQNVGNTYIAR